MDPLTRYQRYKHAFSGYPMPFAFVDLDMLAENIEQVLARSGDKLVRVASKSIRCMSILSYILNSNESFRGLMCFTIPEAVWLAEQGFTDLLVGYPAWEPKHIRAVCRAVKREHHITLMVDSPEHIAHLEAMAREEDCRLPLCLDVDMSSDYGPLHFGVGRSGIQTPERAVDLAREIVEGPHLLLDGIMGYEAQIAGIGNQNDSQRLMSALVRLLQKRSIPEVAKRRAAVAKALQEAGFSPRFVNGGGTGSLSITARESAVTEITAGSAFYAPLLFDYYHDFRYQPAAGYAIQIVRQPRPDLYTCLGGGYVASGKVGADKSPRPYLPLNAMLESNEGAGEVQTPIHYTGPEKLRLGDPIFMRHSKAGELCERFDSLLLVKHGHVVDEVPTYRGDGKVFL